MTGVISAMINSAATKLPPTVLIPARIIRRRKTGDRVLHHAQLSALLA